MSVRTLHFALAVVALCVFVEQAVASDEAEVKIGPSKFALQTTDIMDRSTWQQVTLAIQNRTGRTWRFSRFYDCWAPILVSQNGQVIPLGFARDATMPPHREDFPYVKPGHVIRSWTGCKLVNWGDGLVFTICDQTGGAFSGGVQPGPYKLAISYRATLADSFLFHFAEDFGVKSAAVWRGWKISNWIDVAINGDTNSNPKK